MIVRAKTVTARKETLKQLNSSTEITLRLADTRTISKNISQNAIPVKNLFHIQINISDFAENRIKKASR
jgi:hypothetical protein